MKRTLRLTSLFLALVLISLTLSSCGSGGGRDFSNNYNPETDYQFAFEQASETVITEAPDAYYFLLRDFIYVLDKKSMEVMPLCKKPNCLHDKTDSNDIKFGRIDCEAYYLFAEALFYYDNALYVVSRTMDGKNYPSLISLQKVSLDGTLLENFYTFQGHPQSIIRHRDMIYYTIPSIEVVSAGNTRTTFALMSVSLKDKTETEILTSSLYDGTLDYLSAYGKYLYINDFGYKEPRTDENDFSGYFEQILVYDTETGETTVMETPEENPVSGLPTTVKDGLMCKYWMDNESDEKPHPFYRLSLDGKNPVEAFESSSPFSRIIWDGTYYYEDNAMDVIVAPGETPTMDRKIIIFNDAHEQVDSFTLQKVDNNPENYDFSKNGSHVLSASSDYLLIKASFQNEKYDTIYTLICVDKKQIGTGNVTPFLVWSHVIESEATYSE